MHYQPPITARLEFEKVGSLALQVAEEKDEAIIARIEHRSVQEPIHKHRAGTFQIVEMECSDQEI